MINEKKFNLKKELYSKEVLYRCCYNFIENYFVYLDSIDNEWIVSLKLKNSSQIKDIETLEGEFNNSLLNEVLRDSLAENTKTIKELIVARALYGADNRLDDSEKNIDESDFSFIDDNDDFLEDPLGIAVPWEEKYGDEKNTENNNDS